MLRFAGGESEPDKRTLIDGPVDDVVTATTDAVIGELGEQSVLVGVTRVDENALPITAVREAVANAVAHRSYAATGTHARVEIRPGSVKITSPGSLPEPVTVEHMRTQQAARNPRVLEFLRRRGPAEDLGLGVDRMEDEMQLELLEPPQFEETAQAVSVTLSTRGSVSAEERAWVRRLMADKLIEPRDAVVVLQAVRDRFVTNSSVREALAIDSTEVRAILQRLRDQGVLIQEGERGGAQYAPAPLLGMPNPPPSSIEGQAEQVMALVWERTKTTGAAITNTDVRRLLGVDRPTALRVLSWLVERGTLQREGERRGTRYTLADPSALRRYPGD